jgi:hypothetical protein
MRTIESMQALMQLRDYATEYDLWGPKKLIFDHLNSRTTLGYVRICPF